MTHKLQIEQSRNVYFIPELITTTPKRRGLDKQRRECFALELHDREHQNEFFFCRFSE
jgi:hypothetical protein